jgi:hypothetical protein
MELMKCRFFGVARIAKRWGGIAAQWCERKPCEWWPPATADCIYGASAMELMMCLFFKVWRELRSDGVGLQLNGASANRRVVARRLPAVNVNGASARYELMKCPGFCGANGEAMAWAWGCNSMVRAETGEWWPGTADCSSTQWCERRQTDMELTRCLVFCGGANCEATAWDCS